MSKSPNCMTLASANSWALVSVGDLPTVNCTAFMVYTNWWKIHFFLTLDVVKIDDDWNDG